MNPLKAANPITMTKGAVGLTGTAVGLAETAVGKAVHAPAGVTRTAIHLAGAAAGLAGTVTRETLQMLRPGQGDEPGAVSDVPGAPAGPTIVPVEPHAPDEPPVDVVGEALAADKAAQRGERHDAGFAHEPRGASRDEEHGDASLQRAELDEIAEEAQAALAGDVEPEAHLTEPLLDSAAAKAVAAELATMSKAADPHKG